MMYFRHLLLAPAVLASWFFLMTGPAFSEAPVLNGQDDFSSFESKTATHQSVALAHDDTYDSNTTAHHIELINKLEALQQQVLELRGQLEVQSHQLAALQKGSVTVENTTELESEALLAPAEIKVTAPPPNTANEQVSYLRAYEFVTNKDYSNALSAMQAFVNEYPQSGYTANAYYWIGELFLLEQNYPEAIRHFKLVVNDYPASNKSSASLLKIGYALAEAGKLQDAKQQLTAVIRNYPDTDAAHLALAKLETLRAQ